MTSRSRGEPRRRQIGAWSFFCDSSGQVYADHNPIVTVAAIAIPRETVGTVRSRLVRAFDDPPVKWKVGGLTGLSKVVAVITRFKLHVSIAHVHCTDPATWANFFAQGDEFVRGAQSYLPPDDPLRAADWVPAVMLKSLLLGDGFARLQGWILAGLFPWERGPVTIDLHLITDNDFSDLVTAETYAQRLSMAFKNAPSLPAIRGVVPLVTSRCLTEQDEPLLLLPDYLAGVYHHAEPLARLAKPVVPAAEARAAVADFQMRHRRLRAEFVEFDGTYPMRWVSGRAVPSDRERW
jgi:hypothetical protein